MKYLLNHFKEAINVTINASKSKIGNENLLPSIKDVISRLEEITKQSTNPVDLHLALNTAINEYKKGPDYYFSYHFSVFAYERQLRAVIRPVSKLLHSGEYFVNFFKENCVSELMHHDRNKFSTRHQELDQLKQKLQSEVELNKEIKNNYKEKTVKADACDKLEGIIIYLEQENKALKLEAELFKEENIRLHSDNEKLRAQLYQQNEALIEQIDAGFAMTSIEARRDPNVTMLRTARP